MKGNGNTGELKAVLESLQRRSMQGELLTRKDVIDELAHQGITDLSDDDIETVYRELAPGIRPSLRVAHAFRRVASYVKNLNSMALPRWMKPPTGYPDVSSWRGDQQGIEVKLSVDPARYPAIRRVFDEAPRVSTPEGPEVVRTVPCLVRARGETVVVSVGRYPIAELQGKAANHAVDLVAQIGQGSEAIISFLEIRGKSYSDGEIVLYLPDRA
jgi:hypothetical protein